MLSGLSPDTALGRIVAIRSEKDENVIKHFTMEQKRIYDEWRDSAAKKITVENFADQMADLEKMMAAMVGG